MRTSSEREPLGRMTPDEFRSLEAAATAELRKHGFTVERRQGGVLIEGRGFTCRTSTACEFARDAGIPVPRPGTMRTTPSAE